MKRIPRRLVIGVLPLLGTCCPTLWIQVEKDNPSPWPSVPLPAVEQMPYTTPSAAPNRFDALAGGNQTVAAPRYTDTFDPKNEVNAARSGAVGDLDEIERRFGHPEPRMCNVPATLVCAKEMQSGLEAKCHGVQLSQPVTQAAAVVIRGQRLVVLNSPDQTHPRAALDLSADVAGKQDEPVEICVEPTLELSRTLLSFVHMSDIQLRDPSITLTDRRLSHALDWFDPLSSFEYDEDLASYNQYLIEAMFATINAIKSAPGAEAPRLVIHTGDSIDSGAFGELDRFHVLIDRLRIPFYELFGNHDVLVFGNLTPTGSHDSDGTCAPVSDLLGHDISIARHKLCVDQLVACPTCIGNESELVARSTQNESRQRFMSHLAHVRADRLPELALSDSGSYCPDTQPKVREDGYTRAHGFDLGTQNDDLEGPKLGYYAFVVNADAKRRVVFIALNSEDLEDYHGGTRGRIGHPQLKWLDRVLSCVEREHPQDLVLVFAHQPLSAIDVEPQDVDRTDPKRSVASHLEGHHNVVAYLYGHDHWHSLCSDNRKGVCSQFWEVETASLVEFPQEGRLVRIKQISHDLGFLELTALHERLADPDSELARYVTLARRGAERDFCYTQRGKPKGRCSEDKRAYRTDGRDANARLFFRLP